MILMKSEEYFKKQQAGTARKARKEKSEKGE
jgi:hypothetical protein